MTPTRGEQEQPLVQVRDLGIALPTDRGYKSAVRDVSFTLDAGEVLGIAGESGSGKTLTALSLLGLLPHGARTSGSVRFGSTELLTAGKRELRDIRGRQIALVSQDPSTALHPMLSVERQLTEHTRHHLGLSKSQARERALELLASVRIPDPERALTSHPAQFSGGMRQRIAIAIALACDPAVLLADEPTTALDVTVQAGILHLLDTLRRERGLAIVLITHDLGIMSAIAERLCVMYAGRIVEQGTTAQVLRHPRHPYTRGLLDALPHPESEDAALVPIPGVPPRLGDTAPGCPFHPRCRYAQDRCREHLPVLESHSGGQSAACLIDPFDPDPHRTDRRASSDSGPVDASSTGALGVSRD